MLKGPLFVVSQHADSTWTVRHAGRLGVFVSEMMDTFLEGNLIFFHYLWGRAVLGDQTPSHSVRKQEGIF